MSVPERIGRFEILRKLGEGGMGIVYSGRDEVLDRQVAIKVLRERGDPSGSARLLREARAAARLNHPNICRIYDAGEEDGRLFVAMELLEGESLLAGLGRGAMRPREAIECTLGVLSALEAIHGLRLVHRDVKPSNIFLTPHGPKLLDFGLARGGQNPNDTCDIDAALTRPGVVLGTPRYMAPEQWAAGDLGPATDLFATAAVLFEMITGTPAFPGETILEICESVTRKSPPVLGGGADVAQLDRVLQRALEKRPEDRYVSAAAMAADLRACEASLAGRTESLQIKRTTRFLALPLRILRPDPDTDYLGTSLPDAITASLSGLETLVVRSSVLARKLSEESGDLRAVGRAAEVDVLLTGTLMRAGDRIRVTTQLVDALNASVLWSKTVQVSLGDLFELEDDLVHQIVDSLALPLSSGDRRRLGQDAPANAQAYEFYLRANQITHGSAYASPLLQARDLYRACLAEDPSFAPAWARLGRIYRMLSKYDHEDPGENLRLAKDAFARSLDLNPELSVAHNYYTYLQVEEGQALEAVTRLLARVETRVADPELFAALVVACRFCGLLEASLAAERRARRLDPNVRTSGIYTILMMGDYEAVIATDNEFPAICRIVARSITEGEGEMLADLRVLREQGLEGVERLQIEHILAVLEGRLEDAAECSRRFQRTLFRDPEGIYFVARTCARAGDVEDALRLFTRIVDGGFWCADTFRRDPWLASLQGNETFRGLLDRADAGRRQALQVFERAGGSRLLGVRS